MTAPRLEELEPGQEVGRASFPVRRVDLVRYAGVSGDLNRIHWDGDVARAVGLPDVIAHGMFTMGTVVRVVTDWCGDPGAVMEYGVRFIRPVAVPAHGEAVVDVVATVHAVDAEAGTVTIQMATTSGGVAVLGKARAVVRLRAARGSVAAG